VLRSIMVVARAAVWCRIVLTTGSLSDRRTRFRYRQERESGLFNGLALSRRGRWARRTGPVEVKLARARKACRMVGNSA